MELLNPPFPLWIMKRRLTYSTALCKEASQANERETNLEANLFETHATGVGKNQFPPCIDTTKPTNQPLPSSKNKEKVIVDSNALFSRLVSAREQAKKKKDLTLVACIIGNPMDFPNFFAKHRIDWRYIKGEVRFSNLKCGWSEMIFLNPLELKKFGKTCAIISLAS
ncbi:hypothetical protein V2J09_016631 [Rumex salicifolius]